MSKQRKGSETSPQTSDHDPFEIGDDNADRSSRRKANVYDAVAGRITQAGWLRSADSKSSKQPLRPDEVIFKQARAPTRFYETDYYYAHSHRPPQLFPDEMLLSALHAYVSKLYCQNTDPEDIKTWKCMDESALIAFGTLIEETVVDLLGEEGDLVFTEAANSREGSATES